jgi:ribulose-phosphate 3-epimerase
MFVPKQVCLTWVLAPTEVDWKTACLGSNVIVAGTAIFGADRPEEVIATLKSIVDTAQAKIRE